MVKVSIIGATGYTGLDLVRLLTFHPEVEIVQLVSQNFVGKVFSDIYPSLKGLCDMTCTGLNVDQICNDSDVVINALPHGISKDIVPQFVKKRKKVIDLSADFRYRNVSTYEEVYRVKHSAPGLSRDAVYGIPELYREQIKNADIVATPGCYPTCSIIGLAPLLKNRVIRNEGIVIDALSGISGAGRKEALDYQFCEMSKNFKAYGVTTHRHTTEIEQEFSILAETDILVTFTPHLLPVARGMLATIYSDLKEEYSGLTAADLTKMYQEFYKGEHFIRVCTCGTFPEVKNVAGSNFIDVGVGIDKRTGKIIVVSAQDNMGKGSSGAVVQNLNVLCGFEETTGLNIASLYI